MGLELAQATGLIGSSVLWQGQMVTLVGVNGADAYIETSNASSVVTLAELDLAEASSRTVHRGHFATPGVFRPQHAELCSSEAPEVDPTLNACFDPSTDEGLRESLRQAASSDPLQRQVGRDALREATRRARAEGREAEFNERVQQALNEIAQENAFESMGAEQAYTEVKATLPPANAATAPEGNAPRANANSAPNAGVSAPVGSGNGVSIPLGFGRSDGLTTDGVLPAAFVADGSVVVTSDGNVILATNTAPENGVRPVASSEEGSSSANPLPVVVSAASLPTVLTPFSVGIPAFLPASEIALLDAPRAPDARWEAGFFQHFFGSQAATYPNSGIVSLLTNPTPEFAPKLYEVRRAMADVLRQYRATYGAPSPADRGARMNLNFRYDPERRRIAVSIDPAGRGRTSNVVSGADVSENPFDRFRGPFRSMSLFRIGSDDHLRGEDFGPIVAFVPVPMQYFQNVRLNDGVLVARSDGRATDRGIERPARRDSMRDDSHSGNREGRDSRDGRGDRDRRDQQEDAYAALEESLDSVAA